MMKIDDEKLSAFLDGMLDEAEMRAIEHALETDETLAKRAEQLRLVDPTIAAAYGDIARTPVPQKISALLATRQTAPTTRWNSPRWATALAASIAAVAGIAAGWMMSPRAAPSLLAMSTIAPGNSLFEALQSVKSGDAVSLQPASATFTAITSFHAADRKPCREFMVTDGDQATRAIACRGPESWNVRLAASQPLAPNGGFSPASSDATVAFEAAVDAIEVKPLGREEEAALISRHWRESSE